MFHRHAPHGLARAQKRADGVDAEHTIEPLGGHVCETHLRFEDASVVDEGVNVSEPIVHLGEQPDHVGFRAHVGRDRDGAPSDAFDLIDDLIGCRSVSHVIDADVVAALRGRQRGRKPVAVLAHELSVLGAARLLVGDPGEALAVQDLHRARGAHHGDLGARPCAVPVVSERL